MVVHRLDDVSHNDLHDGTSLQWTKQGKWQRLRLETEGKAASDFDLDGLTFPEGVSSGRLLMPTDSNNFRQQTRIDAQRQNRPEEKCHQMPTPGGWRTPVNSHHGSTKKDAMMHSDTRRLVIPTAKVKGAAPRAPG